MELLLGSGLFLTGILLNTNINKKNQKEINDPTKSVTDLNIKLVKQYPKNFLTNYKSKIYTDSNEFLYNSISNNYLDSVEPDSKIVNNIYRTLNDPYEKKQKNKINNLLNKDINMIKKTYNNNIETMKNINNYGYNDNTSIDSVFSDNYSISNIKQKKKYIDNNSQLSDNYSDNDTNINLKVINQQDKFLSDVITNLSGNDYDNDYESEVDKKQNNSCKTNTFESQFDELKFDHKNIPSTMQNGKQLLNIFNNKISWEPQSDFNPKSDGRYGVTGDMTHNNMVPFFSSKSYGYNPVYDKEKENYSIRQIELFTGSDQNPQFKHKKEVTNLFSPETNKVESVTGMPNFNDYFESRYIPSQTRNGELLMQPIRTTPGLNLGYTQIGNTGKQDLYRVLPKTVDQLRTVNNPKVSYTPLINPGQKGDRRGIIGDFIQKGPDKFYYNDPDSLLPQVGDHVAPAIYGKWIVDQTNRSLNPNTPGLNPLKGEDKATPEYLQGQFKRSFKREDETIIPANVKRDTRGQIINQETWIPNETNRQSTNFNSNYTGNVIGNKTQTYLENFENAIPDITQRETMPELPNANITGNYKTIPLINFINLIPDATKRQILLEDNGRKNITNISNSIKGYLYNSINAIQDPTLRDLISQKIILTNQKGPEEQNYLFNMTNAIQDPNMRNLSEDNIILTTISNKEQGYLFNNINAIPDSTLRELLNTLYGSGGLNFKGNYSQDQMFNYANAIPDTTLKELTENIIQLTNVTGPVGSVKQYLFNYIDSIPDTTIRELTEDKIVLTGIKPIQVKEYLYNYINNIPDTTLKELTENQKYLIGQKANHNKDIMFNYNNGIPDTTLRELIEDLQQITNLTGDHKAQYMINYINTIPDTTLRELTENKENLTNLKPIQIKDYLINYLNATPDATLRDLTQDQQYLVGQKGNRINGELYNYANGILDSNLRNATENNTNIIGQKGYHLNEYMFNYANGIANNTNRNMTEDTKNIIGQKSQYTHKEYIFNYTNGIPDSTQRNMTENNKNIIGQKGDGTQNRSRLDYSNALLNTVKENVAKGRAPTIVKDNKGPTCTFTEYTFNDDKPLTNRPIYGNTKPLGNISNYLYTFS